MTSEADMEDALRELAAASATHQAQLIGLAAVIAHLPGVGRIDRAVVDAAIEDQCRQRGREYRDTASTFAHGILQAATVTAEPGTYSTEKGHVRGYQRGS